MINANHSLKAGEFEKYIGSGVSLVDFSAPWCAPCRTQKPVIDELAEQFKDKALVLDLNVDENQRLAMGLDIMSIPTLVVFKDGKEVQRFVGIQQSEVLAEAIENALN